MDTAFTLILGILGLGCIIGSPILIGVLAAEQTIKNEKAEREKQNGNQNS